MSRKKTELALSVAIVLFLAWILWEARDWPVHSKLFPWSLGFAVLALASVQVVVSARAVWRESRVVVEGGGEKTTGAPAARAGARALAIYGWVLGFFFGIWLLGFKVGSFVLTFSFLKVTAREPWGVSAALAAGTYLFFLLVFDMALHMPLGAGAIADYLGMQSLDFYLLRAIRRLFGAA